MLRVNLYPTRAEVTRLFKLTVKRGSNRINISALPTVIDPDSLRCSEISIHHIPWTTSDSIIGWKAMV
jgi:hypothetical protein